MYTYIYIYIERERERYVYTSSLAAGDIARRLTSSAG